MKIAVILLLVLGLTPAFAADQRVGEVDIAKLMQTCTKTAQMKAEIDRDIAKSKASIAEKEKEIQQLNAEVVAIAKRVEDNTLSASTRKLAAAEGQSKQDHMKQRYAEYQQFVKTSEQAMQKRMAEMNKIVNVELRAQSIKLAKDKGLSAVVPKGLALFTDNPLDVTEDLVALLNAANKPDFDSKPAGGDKDTTK